MTAHIHWSAEWQRARARRAMAGRGPRLSIQRSIILQQASDGEWAVAIYELKFGAWKRPTWLSGRIALVLARKAALAAWDEYRLPLLWAYADGSGVRPYYIGINEPRESRS